MIDAHVAAIAKHRPIGDPLSVLSSSATLGGRGRTWRSDDQGGDVTSAS